MRVLLLILSAISCLGAFNPAQVASWHPSLLNGSVGYWPLDESANGSPATSSWAGYVLTDVNTVDRTAGIISNGALMSGSDYLLNSDTNAFHLPGDFTISCWTYRKSNAASFQTLLSKYDTFPKGLAWSLRFDGSYNTGKLSGYLGDGTNYVFVQSPNSTPTNVWLHCVFVHSGGSLILWTNGATAASTNETLTSMPKASLRIGTSGGSESYIGIIDEVGIWNRALTPVEIVQLFNQTKGRRFPFNSGP